jgi:hypothetical protein
MIQDTRTIAPPQPLATHLPLGSPSESWQIEFSSNSALDPRALGQPFGERRQHQILRVGQRQTSQLERGDLEAAPLTVLVLPHFADEGLELLSQVQTWLDATWPGPLGQRAQLLSLPGAHLLWHPRCIALRVPPDRVVGVAQAILEAHFYEQELRAIESGVEDLWEATVADAPLGFEFSHDAIPRRQELSNRFQTVVQLRTRQSRLASHILVPHVFPPTLASQIGERFRERLRMEERLELLDGKLGTQENVYELCGQRTSEFMVARTGHHLEWAIIVLLAFQTVMWLIDLSASASP